MAEKSTTEKGRYVEAVGRRKTSTARVRLLEATKASFVVNGVDAKDYFKTEDARRLIQDPIVKAIAALMPGVKWSIEAKMSGGGIHSQAEALRHGLSRAFVALNAESRGKLKTLGFLKRDSRAKERRKFGLKKLVKLRSGLRGNRALKGIRAIQIYFRKQHS